MFLVLVTSIAALLLAYVLWTCVCLERNVLQASRMGIPVVRLLIDSHNIPWQVVEALVWSITDRLLIPWLSWPEPIRLMRRGWHFYEKAEAHARYGPIWALVSGASTNVLVSDPDAIREILTRRRDFVRIVKNYKVLDVFGPSISTADVDNWSRHRKAVAAPFNESTMKFIWSEAVTQTTAITKAWSQPEVTAAGITSVQDDMRFVSLNVLAASGLRKSIGSQTLPSSIVREETSYRAALQTILDNAIPLMLIPYQILMAPIVPQSWRKIGQAGDRFKQYMVQMVKDETEAIQKGEPGAGGIMTSLVRALEVSEKGSTADSALAKGLSLEEVFGNLFVINFAGHDTTANTLAFAMLLLARDPDLQQWVAEEIAQVTEDSLPEEWAYDALFEKLLRCRAILYETLRVYPPIMAIPRGTGDRTQILEVKGRSIAIPPNTDVTVMLLACHTNPSLWSEPLEWKPKRWITRNGSFYRPPPWTFFPWSDGPQNCPGKKFAEVTVVAVLAVMLQKHRLRVKCYEGESPAAASERVLKTVNDCNMEMLLRMKDADSVRVQYKSI